MPGRAVLADHTSRRAERILVMKFRSPGDVLLMVPALKALKRKFPEAAISVALNAEAAPLLELHPAVSELLPYGRAGRPASLLGRAGFELGFARQIRSRRFDVAINATEGDRGALLALASGAPTRVGIDPRGSGLAFKRRIFGHLLPAWPKDRHNVMCNLDLVALLGAEISDRGVELALADSDARRIEELLASGGIDPGQPLAHVHAPSRVSYKRWRPEAVAAVVDHLELERAVRVVLSGATQEAAYVQAIVGLCRSRPLDLAGRLSLRQAGALARRARLFFGVDTVVMHLAAAVGTPVVALFGPTIASGWGPWDNSGPALQYPARCGVQQSGPHIVVQAERDCVPCGNMGCQRSGRSACLEELAPREVIPVLDGALERCLRNG
jgi:heptosyltransferase-3